jgi:hypothetical protein
VFAFWNLFKPFFGSNLYDFLNSYKALLNYRLAANVIPIKEYKTGFLGFI